MNVNEAIRQKIADVAANKLSVWAFEQWIEPLSWSMHRDLSAADVNLIGSLQSLFARFDYDQANESALRKELLDVFERLCPPKFQRLWHAESAGSQIRVSLSFDPEPAPEIVRTLATPSRQWFVPALVEL